MMIYTVMTCLQEQHDIRFVVAAILICILSSTTAVHLLGNCHNLHFPSISTKLLPAICVTSIGIWATHFVAVLGYDTGLDTCYNLAITGIAALFSFVTVAFGMVFGVFFNSVLSYALGGLYLGLGIAVMHFLGMFAVQVHGWMVFHLPYTIFAIVAGCLLSALAFTAFACIRSTWRYPVASFLMVVAVCTLHFIAMSWTEFIPSPDPVNIADGINGTVLAIVVFSLWVFVTVIALARHWSFSLDEADQLPAGLTAEHNTPQQI